MKQRCGTKTGYKYHRYGGRGITICERWLSFENFRSDMGERPPGMTLERINNDGNYEPGNCRWASRAEQVRNSTAAKLNAQVAQAIRDAAKQGLSQRQIAKLHGISRAHAWRIIHGYVWR